VKFTLVADERFTAVGTPTAAPTTTRPRRPEPGPDSAELEEAIDLTDAPPHRPEARSPRTRRSVVDEVPRTEERSVAKAETPGQSPGELMRQMQRMQQDMSDAQAALAAQTVEGSAGGGMVKATASGNGELRAGVDLT